MNKQQSKTIKMTYDIVFKKFFIDKPELLKLILKHFLELPGIQKLTITNPEIPELDERKSETMNEGTELGSEGGTEARSETEAETPSRSSLLPVIPSDPVIPAKAGIPDSRFRGNDGLVGNDPLLSTTKKESKRQKDDLKEELAFLEKSVKDFMSCFSIRRDSEPYILFNKDLKIVIVELSKLNKSSFDLLDFK